MPFLCLFEVDMLWSTPSFCKLNPRTSVTGNFSILLQNNPGLCYNVFVLSQSTSPVSFPFRNKKTQTAKPNERTLIMLSSGTIHSFLCCCFFISTYENTANWRYSRNLIEENGNATIVQYFEDGMAPPLIMERRISLTSKKQNTADWSDTIKCIFLKLTFQKKFHHPNPSENEDLLYVYSRQTRNNPQNSPVWKNSCALKSPKETVLI